MTFGLHHRANVTDILRNNNIIVVSLHEYTGLLNNNNKYSQKVLSQKQLY